MKDRGRRVKPKARKAPVEVVSTADLQEQVAALTRELKGAQEQQTATANVLKVISRSTFELEAVLGTLLESAAHLCEADLGHIALPEEGDTFRIKASYGFTAELADDMSPHQSPCCRKFKSKTRKKRRVPLGCNSGFFTPAPRPNLTRSSPAWREVLARHRRGRPILFERDRETRRNHRSPRRTGNL